MSEAQSSMKPTALSVADAARVLSKAGSRSVTEAALREDIARGAPINPDGTINLLHYAAWLAREVVTRGD